MGCCILRVACVLWLGRVLAQVYGPLTAAAAPPDAAPAPRFEAWNAAMRAGKQRRTVGERWLEMLLAVPGEGGRSAAAMRVLWL